jgi:hypothetical protein
VAREVRPYDDVTDRRLRLLVGLVVVLGSAVVVWALVAASFRPKPEPWPVLPIALIVAIAIGNRTTLWIRVRSEKRGVSWTEVGVLVGLTLAPPAWVVLCTAVAIAISKLTARMALRKAVFSVAKEVLVACTASAVFVAMDVAPNARHPDRALGTIALAAAAMWIVDESLFGPVIALATRRDIREALRENWDLRVLNLIARYVVTVLVVAMMSGRCSSWPRSCSASTYGRPPGCAAGRNGTPGDGWPRAPTS